MRNKIARRKRKEMLRLGAKITYLGKIFTREDLPRYGLTRSENNEWRIHFEYKGFKYTAFGRDLLYLYKLALWCMEPDKYPEPID